MCNLKCKPWNLSSNVCLSSIKDIATTFIANCYLQKHHIKVETMWKFSSALLHFCNLLYSKKMVKLSEVQKSVREFLHGLDLGTGKVEKILKGSLYSIPSPSPAVKIQIMGGKVCLRCKGKRQNIAGNCQQTFENKKFFDIT